MAGLPWIKVWTAIGQHPKVQRLERELGIKDALGVVVRLWCWTADYHPDGEIPEAHGLDGAKVARGDACRRTPADVLAILVSCSLLDRVPDGYRVHDWQDMQTVHVDAEEKRKALAAERQARYRERHGVVTDGNGTRNGTRNASRNALRDGYVTHPGVTEREREKEIEKIVSVGERDSCSAPPPLVNAEQVERDTARRLGTEHGGLPTQDELREKRHPRAASLLAACRLADCPAGWPKSSAGCHELEMAIGDQPLDAVLPRVLAAVKDTGRLTLGWHTDAIRGKPQEKANPKAMAPPSTDWPTETREVKL